MKQDCKTQQFYAWRSAKATRGIAKPQPDERVLGWCTDDDGGYVDFVTYWGAGEGWTNDDGYDVKISHWMPCPSPPNR